MKRRKFLKTSAVAAGLVGSLKFLPDTTAEESGSTSGDNRPDTYLKRARQDPFQPKPPVLGKPYSIAPMALAQRVKNKVVPARGFCSLAPASLVNECLITGNGPMNIELMGDPYAERILFHHESILPPWPHPIAAPNIADIFSQVRQMAMNGNHREAMALAFDHLSASSLKPETEPRSPIPAFLMRLDYPKSDSVKDYLRTLDFESGEIQIHWADQNGEWLRQTFASRPDNVIVQRLAAPEGHSLNLRLALETSEEWTMTSGASWGNRRNNAAPKAPSTAQSHQEVNPQRLVYTSRLNPSVDNSGYAGVTRVILSGGSARVDGGALVIENANSALLLTRIEYYPDFSDDKVEALSQAVASLPSDYSELLNRHQKVQSEMLNRVTVDFGGAAQYGLSIEELLTDQRSRPDFSPALLEKVFEMGRHWFIVNSGQYPPLNPQVNFSINLLTAGAVQGNLGMEAYFNWIESLAPDCGKNAQNIFGFRGAVYPFSPDKDTGVNYYYNNGAPIGLWPYWISAGGWALRPLWENYLATGDLHFLRQRVVPRLKELAEFYEDYLTATDKNGNFVFAPSISPENTPVALNLSDPLMVNATLDITVCREVLTRLIESSQILGTDSAPVAKWKDLLAHLPPYSLDLDGTLKEWSSPNLQEHFSHRYISHLYGAWPGDEFDPDRTPQLARAATIANRRRTFDTMSTAVSGETLPAYTRSHRALAAARLKDHLLVNIQLRQLLEQGYVSSSLRCSRDPYGTPIPDAHGAFPAIIAEMLAYSRPGIIEILPALPTTLPKGTIRGLLLRTSARLDSLTWDLDTRTVELAVTSLRNQDVTLIARHGIENISAPDGILALAPSGAANCDLHLPEGKTVTLRLKLSRREPVPWIEHV